MIIETGHFALILAFAVACLQSISVVWAVLTRDEAARSLTASAAITQFALIFLAFAALTWAYIASDFSVYNVAANSHSAKPLLYKISGVWGNHEGSMLLWVLMLSAFGAAVALFGNNLPMRLKSNVLAIQGTISIAFLAFIVLTSNPFIRLDPAPPEGNGLNPILQDPGLAIHPPLLYAGYVGLSIAYSFAVAALIEGQTGTAWARWVRPWTLAAWMFLTLGIVTGSWWAYYELGWGGWWYWDPVENASFMPWLAATGLLHSAVVMEKREALKAWTVFLAIFAFTLSLVGTFIVRSGVLTSVHSFAVDPARGVFVLAIITVLGFGALVFFGARAPYFRQGGLFSPTSREAGLLLNNIVLVVACFAVFLGTLYPLFIDALYGEKLSVGAPFFNGVFGWLMVPLLIALPFGPFLSWKRGNLADAAHRLIPAAALAVSAMIAVLAVLPGAQKLPAFGVGLAVWVVAGTLSELVFRVKVFSARWPEVWRRLINLPRASYGTSLAHVGTGLMVLGIVASTTWRQEHAALLSPGETIVFAGYSLTFQQSFTQQGPNYIEDSADFMLGYRVGISNNEASEYTKLGNAGKPPQNFHTIQVLTSAKRRYIAPSSMTTETAIYRGWLGDFYLAVSEIGGGNVSKAEGGGAAPSTTPENSVSVRLYFNPLVRLIWIGGLVMVLGGLFSLVDRRLRVGAPMRKRHPVATAAPSPNIAGQPL